MSLKRIYRQNSTARPTSVPLLTEAETAPAKNCHRLIILGSARVGKTAIVKRFLANKFDDKYTPTIEDFHRKVYRIKGEAYRLDILDTSGNDPFPAMKRLCLLTGDLFVLVYSIESRDSFNEVRRILDQIYASKTSSDSPNSRTARRPKIPLVIVGNKTDVDTEREIGTDELVELADQCPCSGYIETSAKTDQNIEEVFVKLFLLAKLPVEMSPSMHRKVQPMYTGGSGNKDSESRASSFKRTVTIRRRLSDACGAVAPHARRPSIRTDLLMWQTKRSLSQDCATHDMVDSTKCVIQ